MKPLSLCLEWVSFVTHEPPKETFQRFIEEQLESQ
jgi:hypothetical protein